MGGSPTEKSNEKRIEPRKLKGFRDYNPDLMETRSAMQSQIRKVARLAGFREIGTPVLEYEDVLLGQGSDETDKQVYRFEDHGGRRVAMRFDLTVPFARFVAEHQGTLVFPFKRLQIGDVWRGENTQKGRYREFCQCDLDIIGVDSMAADYEILASFCDILSSFGCGPFTMRLGHRVILSGLLQHFGIPEICHTAALIAIDKLDKIGVAGVVGLLEKIELPTGHPAADQMQKLMEALLPASNDPKAYLDRIQSLCAHQGAVVQEVQRLRELITVLQERSPQGCTVKIDLSTARGLAYYTGVVFETTLDQLPGFGSICSGGRYNNLADRFMNRNLPGVGGSIGLDRLLAGLEELQILKSHATKVDVLVAVASTDAFAAAAKIATDLRKAGICTDLGLVAKLANQFKHADRLGCRYVITLGTAEVADKTCNLKDMKSGEEKKSIPQASLLSLLQLSQTS
jgi:histidyl-tRNA synthetase